MELPRTSVHDHHMKNPKKRKGRREDVKVVYISSPVKVKTCASRFRALVQELTGRDSDVSRYMEANNVSYHDDSQQVHVVDHNNSVSDRVSDSTTTTTSSENSYFEPSFDDFLMNSNGQGGFLGMFPTSNLLCDQGFEFNNGVVGGYGAG